MTISPRQQIVEQRLKTWLSGDPSGVRRAALALFLHQKDLTIEDVYDQLAPIYPISYHGVGGMIGLISSKIGVLQGTRDDTKRCRQYNLKEKDVPSVRKILTS